MNADQAVASIGGLCVTPWPDCILWMGDTSRGYAKVVVDGVKKRGHRVVWERVNGPIPEGLELDHLCRVRNCVNPEHLEPVTHQENVRRSLAASTRAPITHCIRGHEFTPENTYRKASGSRQCRACTAMRDALRGPRARPSLSPSKAPAV